MNHEEHNWCMNAAHRGGGFVSNFAKACLAADLHNLHIVTPALKTLMDKYPEYHTPR